MNTGFITPSSAREATGIGRNRDGSWRRCWKEDTLRMLGLCGGYVEGIRAIDPKRGGGRKSQRHFVYHETFKHLGVAEPGGGGRRENGQ
jgi:hypothetical protein